MPRRLRGRVPRVALRARRVHSELKFRQRISHRTLPRFNGTATVDCQRAGADRPGIRGNGLATGDRQHRPERGRSETVGELEDMRPLPRSARAPLILLPGPFPEPSLTPKLIRSRSRSSGFIQRIPEDAISTIRIVFSGPLRSLIASDSPCPARPSHHRPRRQSSSPANHPDPVPDGDSSRRFGSTAGHCSARPTAHQSDMRCTVPSKDAGAFFRISTLQLCHGLPSGPRTTRRADNSPIPSDSWQLPARSG